MEVRVGAKASATAGSYGSPLTAKYRLSEDEHRRIRECTEK